MSSFSIDVDTRQILVTINHLQARVADLSPAMRAIAGMLESRTAENFAKQSGPLGKWPALKKAPRNKRRTIAQILVDTARLKNSVTARHGADFAEVGSNVIYAAIHQLGGDIQIAARSQQAYFKQAKDGSIGNRFVRKSQSNFAQWHTRGEHTVHMPARPFLPFVGNKLQAGVEAEIIETLKRFLDVK